MDRAVSLGFAATAFGPMCPQTGSLAALPTLVVDSANTPPARGAAPWTPSVQGEPVGVLRDTAESMIANDHDNQAPLIVGLNRDGK
jgi:hypothetical protein